MEILKAEHFCFKYQNCKANILDDINLTVNKGDFVVLCGYSGSGKTTLLRHFKPELAPHGKSSGKITFNTDSQIGFVMQNPDNSAVTDKVWHELVFGLENLGLSKAEITERLSDISDFFNLSDIMDKNISELSGGQKQIVNIASVMIMYPELLILDEPLSQLSPDNADKLLDLLKRINTGRGTTVIMSEHRPENVLPYVTKTVVMDNGRILCDGDIETVGRHLKDANSSMFHAMPVPMRVWASVTSDLDMPVTDAQGKEFIERFSSAHTLTPPPVPVSLRTNGEQVLCVKDLSFTYSKKTKPVLTDVSFTANSGEITCIFGDNGCGKTTFLKLLSEIEKADTGTVEHKGKIALLPQNPQTVFLKDNIYNEFSDILRVQKVPHSQCADKISEISKLCKTENILNSHPYDISGGEMQRTALAGVLLTEPNILLLDEPTKGLDAPLKKCLGDILVKLRNNGMCIIIVSHDTEFCAKYSDFCAVIANGTVSERSSASDFFCNNPKYVTHSHIITESTARGIITDEQAISLIGGTVPDIKYKEQEYGNAVSLTDRGEQHEKKKLSLYTLLSLSVILLLIPLTLWLGMNIFEKKQYYIISLLIIVESMLPFFILFEDRHPKPRELVMTATLCALGIAGRSAFVMIPQFKPVLAFTVIVGIAFGGETGFITGAVTMLVSNILFSQGPWTPFQMFSAGIIGYIAGLLFNKLRLPSKRIFVCLYGALSTYVFYGGIMNAVTPLMWGSEGLNLKIILSYYVSGFPADTVHAAATVIFLYVGAKPLLKIFARVKSKYGIFN